MRTTTRVLLGALTTALLIAEAQAQEGPEIGVRGRITGPDGSGLPHVLLRARSSETVVEARTDEQGNYRLVGATVGTWVVTMRRIGFAADSVTVELTDRLDILSRGLQPLVARIGEQRITDSWLGVHGVVGDKDYQPVAAASIEVVGREDEVTSSVDGQFALPQLAGASVLLRVSATGFRSQLVSAKIPATGSVGVSLLLDRAEGVGPNKVIADELDRRMNWSSPLALYVTGAELIETDTRDLSFAVNLAPAAVELGLRVSPSACVFVDGVPRPGLPLAAVNPENVEFIEVYTRGADRTGLLARRWPPRGECGASGTSSGYVRRVNSSSSSAQYVVVWTRNQN